MDLVSDKKEIQADLSALKDTFQIAHVKKYLDANMEECFGMLDMITHRVTLLYFMVGTYKLCGLKCRVSDQEIIDWIYKQQVQDGAFRGGDFLGFGEEKHNQDMPHIANTYAALAILHFCGDKEFSKVNRKKCLEEVVAKCFDEKSGEFKCLKVESERDARFTYCACAISKLLGDMSYLDKPKIVDNLIHLQTYTGGFAWNQDGQAHAGITYCIVASLSILESLDKILNLEKLIQFLTNRFVGAFNGRINKPPDCCYSFWCLASLKLLSQDSSVGSFLQSEGIVAQIIQLFNLQCYGKGGFSKYPELAGKFPDIYHTFYALSSISLLQGSLVKLPNQVNPELGILK